MCCCFSVLLILESKWSILIPYHVLETVVRHPVNVQKLLCRQINSYFILARLHKPLPFFKSILPSCFSHYISQAPEFQAISLALFLSGLSFADHVIHLVNALCYALRNIFSLMLIMGAHASRYLVHSPAHPLHSTP